MPSHINDTYLGLMILASDLVGHEPLFVERPPTCPTRPYQLSSLRVVLLVPQVTFPLQRAVQPHLTLLAEEELQRRMLRRMLRGCHRHL